MIILTKEAVIIKAQAALENIRGISVSENWHNSRPVTMAMLIEEAIERHPEIMWFGDDIPDVPLSVKNILPEQESDQVAPAGAAEEDPAPAAVDDDHEEAKTPTDLGKWAEYQARALSNDEINFVIKNMRNEGYSFARISTVVRLTPPAVSARYAKISKE